MIINGGFAATTVFDGKLDGGKASTVYYSLATSGGDAFSDVEPVELNGAAADTTIFNNDVDGGTAFI